MRFYFWLRMPFQKKEKITKQKQCATLAEKRKQQIFILVPKELFSSILMDLKINIET